MKMKKRANIRL